MDKADDIPDEAKTKTFTFSHESRITTVEVTRTSPSLILFLAFASLAGITISAGWYGIGLFLTLCTVRVIAIYDIS